MIAKLAFGDDTVPVDLRGLRVRPLTPAAPPGSRDVAALVAEALDGPLDRAPLVDLSAGCDTATVVVPDATRYAALPEVLPPLLDRIRRGGVPSEGTTVLVACGTHPPTCAENLHTLLGVLPEGVEARQHDSRDADRLVPVGAHETGCPVRLDRGAVEADILVTLGPVRHHYFAGFGGGPKLVFPGLAGYEEIQRNHSRVLEHGSHGPSRHPCCEPGVLDGNPVAEEIADAASLRPPDLSLSLVGGQDGGIAWAAAGSWQAAFVAAVDRVRTWYERELGPFRLMVASAGGTPSDSTLIQAHKAMDAACRFLEPGGELLLVASLESGSGSPDMQPFLNNPRPEAILEGLSDSWVQYGHTTLRLVEKTSRYRVHLHSHLEPSLARRLGFIPVSDPDEVVEQWRIRHPGETAGVMASTAVYPRS